MKFLSIAYIIIIIICVAEFSCAQVDSSPHDMIAQEFFAPEDIGERSNCSYCHMTFREPGNKIWKSMPKSLQGFGAIGPFCYSCHDGVTVVDINVDASRTVFSPKSHGLNLKKIPENDQLQSVKLKYVQEGKMECTTCHEPHNSTNRPFLSLPFAKLCITCHQSRRNSGFGSLNLESNHPVYVAPSDSTGGASPIKPADIFKTKFPSAYPGAGGKFSPYGHWDLGGHLTSGYFGNIECYTCHTVHGDEIAGPNEKLMTVDPVRDTSDKFCEGCHKGERGDGEESSSAFPNPGGTKEPRTYHPADDDKSNGAGRIYKINEPTNWQFGTNEEKNILCSTCHDVHYGLPNSPILRTPLGNTFCEECHDENLQGHHLSGSASNPRNVTFATTGFKWQYESETKWENGNPKLNIEADATSNGYGKTYGKLVENKIYCSSCHRAHNAGNGVVKKAVPSLIVSYTANQLCNMCHYNTNIAFNTNLDMTASHFLGDSTRADTYELLLDKVSIYREEWPETKLKSKFGGDNELEIICESCHSFSPKNLNSSEYGYENNTSMLIARSDEKLEWIVENPEHKKETENADTAVPKMYYLCVGCHGENPGGSNSHPMMNINLKMPDGSMIDVTKITPPATLTKSLFLNCESCHFIHTSINKGGVYIMKGVDGENTDPLAIKPDIDFTNFCTFCHKDQ